MLLSISFASADIPPLSFFPESPSISSTRIILLFEKRLLCIIAGPSVNSMLFLFLKSDALSSKTS